MFELFVNPTCSSALNSPFHKLFSSSCWFLWMRQIKIAWDMIRDVVNGIVNVSKFFEGNLRRTPPSIDGRFHMIPYGFHMVSIWFPYGFHMVSIWVGFLNLQTNPLNVATLALRDPGAWFFSFLPGLSAVGQPKWLRFNAERCNHNMGIFFWFRW